MLGWRGEFEGVADWLPVLPLWCQQRGCRLYCYDAETDCLLTVCRCRRGEVMCSWSTWFLCTFLPSWWLDDFHIAFTLLTQRWVCGFEYGSCNVVIPYFIAAVIDRALFVRPKWLLEKLWMRSWCEIFRSANNWSDFGHVILLNTLN